MNNNRLFRRRSITINFRVYDADSGDFLGRIGDLSPGGFLIYGSQMHAGKKTVRVRIDYPDITDTPCSAHFDAQIQWSRVDVNPELYATGLRLIGLDQPDAAQALEALLDRFTVGSDPEFDDD